jgi:hypothetical protein
MAERPTVRWAILVFKMAQRASRLWPLEATNAEIDRKVFELYSLSEAAVALIWG